jgi:A/G-specific adenine glycosylase
MDGGVPANNAKAKEKHAVNPDALKAGRERRRRLRAWSEKNGRNYPWRLAGSTWATLMAEMLLRRTRADQVAAYLPGLLLRYPCPEAMAESLVDDVIDSLKPLGLVWRARDLSRCAQVVTGEYGGKVPLQEQALLELPGVGPYVANSVRAVAGGTVLLTDTNTVRVAARTKGIELKGDIRRRSDVQVAINELLGGPATARDWWAVIDLAAMICRPSVPLCSECPISALCTAGRECDNNGVM